MNKLFYLLIPTALLLVTCKNPVSELKDVDETPIEDNVVVPDSVFEQVLRIALNLPSGDITKNHLDTLRMIEFPYLGGEQVQVTCPPKVVPMFKLG